MAERKRKSQAEKAVSAAKGKKKSTGGKKGGKQTAAAPAAEKKFPTRFVSSLIFLGLFVLFLAIFLDTDGALPAFIEAATLRLVGYVGFIVAIPAFLYLFIIHAFSGKRPIIMRSICLGCFVLICGCISHLAMNPEKPVFSWELMVHLWNGGLEGTTGGLICGFLCVLVRLLCGLAISYIIFILAAILTLLGAMKITVPSIIRAFQNRPQPDWEPEPKPEPAEVVVNHIAKKRIARLEQKKNHANTQIAQPQPVPELPQPPAPPAPAPEPPTEGQMRIREFLSQIEGDVSEPVSAAGANVPVIPQTDPVPEPDNQAPTEGAMDAVPLDEEVPEEMPELELKKSATPKVVKPKKVSHKETPPEPPKRPKPIPVPPVPPEVIPNSSYCYPPIDLLSIGDGSSGDATAEMKENTKRLAETLSSFKIDARIINVTQGPSVTRYEVELDKGVRLNKLTTAADDIALSLGASGVRIAAVPGKISIVGIEVPNQAVSKVYLREVIDSSDFAKAKSKASFAVGKDIGGNCIIGNITKLPHMLIAGTTGSGKSVCMNCVIISLLYKASPEDVKLIMIDPKMVELGIYNGIPHLLIPVVTDPKKAAGSLQWAVTEMMRRYKAMSEVNVRDVESYNKLVADEEGKKLSQIVVIIDELADLMLVAAKEVEESICRIAQMGRAAGMHLIIATQRPSADVITGLMKANIPSRIAFSVASAMESRIILDNPGAEKLVGKGDMLYFPIGGGKPKRVQGCFVSDEEVEAVATYVKDHFTPNYDDEIMKDIERKAAQTGKSAPEPDPVMEQEDGDEMLPAAVDVILETGQASVSLLQRRLKLGYARAARIVDEMEEKGIVGPHQGSKPRTILVTKEQWAAMRGGAEQMNFDDLEEVPEDDEEVDLE